jgi:hypothetical protein
MRRANFLPQELLSGGPGRKIEYFKTRDSE